MYFPFQKSLPQLSPSSIPPARGWAPLAAFPCAVPGMLHSPCWHRAGCSCSSSASSSRQWPGMAERGRRSRSCAWARRPAAGMSAGSIIKHLNPGGDALTCACRSCCGKEVPLPPRLRLLPAGDLGQGDLNLAVPLGGVWKGAGH